jgi:hypothetical protein
MPPQGCKPFADVNYGKNLETEFTFSASYCYNPQNDGDITYTWYTFDTEQSKNKALAIFEHTKGNQLAPKSTENTLRTVLPAGLDSESNFVYVVCATEDVKGAIDYI